MRTPTLLLPLLLAACGDATAEQAEDKAGPTIVEVPQAPGTRVEVARIQPTKASLEVRLPGEVAGSRDSILGAANGGYVESLSVKRGQLVRRGQSIARIDTRTYAAQRDQAKAQRDLAASELKRLEAVTDLASASQLEGARTQLAVTKASLDLAETRLSRAYVTAPFSGVIGQTAVESGEVVGPGSPVARLVQLDPVHVTVSVSDRDIGALRIGQRASVSTDAVAKVFEGEVVAVDPAADLRTRTFMAEVAVANPDGVLLPGMIASVALSAELDGEGTVVPQDWIVTRLDGVGIFIVEDGVARWRPVETGDVLHDQVSVTSGLDVGDQIVTTGHRSLADGDELIVSREGTCCTGGRVTY
jgi:membrane fusion protein, multidrug efflux system